MGALAASTLLPPMACSAAGGESIAPGIDASLLDVAADDTDAWSLLDTGMDEGGACREGDAWVGVPSDEDHDHDGWSIAQGDCNDCDPNTNPGAYDVASNGVDEDCSGQPDDEPSSCDDMLDLLSNEGQDGARAIGLCRFASAQPIDPRARTWGVISADYVLADGTLGMHYASHGILPDFGPHVHPQQGARMLALSSAAARRPGDVGYRDPTDANMGTSCATPSGWPKDFPSCPNPVSTSPVANDSASLALRIRVPTNARGLSFKLSFYTSEFPGWVCRQFNDYFVALLGTAASNPGAQDGNISFDPEGNAISVNTAFLDVCAPQAAGGKVFACLQGNAALEGTGFEATSEEPRGHGATGWLQTQAAVLPGEEISLAFVIWDAGDHLWGSTVLLDDFQWLAQGGEKPETVRVDDPK